MAQTKMEKVQRLAISTGSTAALEVILNLPPFSPLYEYVNKKVAITNLFQNSSQETIQPITLSKDICRFHDD